LPTTAHYARSSTFFVIVQYHPDRAAGFDDAAASILHYVATGFSTHCHAGYRL
jgi:hypothetical protein